MIGIVATHPLVPDIVILPPGTRLTPRSCIIHGELYRIIGAVRLADGHVEWQLDRPCAARCGDVVTFPAVSPAPSLPCALTRAADFDVAVCEWFLRESG